MINTDNNDGFIPDLVIDEGFGDPASVGDRYFGSFSIDEDPVKYIGNKNSHVFHRLECSSVQEMKAKNKVEFYDREEAVEMGYTPCHVCRP